MARTSGSSGLKNTWVSLTSECSHAHATIEDVTSVGLVLGAGGVVGHAYHAGTLATIAEVTGWDPRTAAVIVGTSAGSGVGATLRAGLAARDFAARITGEPLSSEGAALLEGHGAAAAAAASRPQVGGRMRVPRGADAAGPRSRRAVAVPSRKGTCRARARRPRPHDGDGRSDAPAPQGAVARRPLWICALRLSDGARVVFGRDPAPEPDVGTAVEASSAIPGFFAPVVIDGERYVDGGAHSPTNADLVARIGLDLVVVLSPMSARTEALMFNLRAAARGLHRSTLHRELERVRFGHRCPVLRAHVGRHAGDGDQRDGPEAHGARGRASTAFGSRASRV